MSEKVFSTVGEDGSGFSDKLFIALGAFDANFSPPLGDSDGLLAVWAAVIAVLVIQHPGLPGQEAAVFQEAFFQIFGKHAQQIPNQQDIGHQTDQHSDKGTDSPEAGQDNTDKIQDHGSAE